MQGKGADPVEEPPVEFRSLLPFPTDEEGSFDIEREDLITCYRVLLSFHQLMSDAVALRPPPLNRHLCEIMRKDLDRALLAIRTINQIEAGAADVGRS